jgi:hypothetical protein
MYYCHIVRFEVFTVLGVVVVVMVMLVMVMIFGTM